MNWWTQIKEDLATLAPVGLSFAILIFCGLAASRLGIHVPGTTATETGLFVGVILGPVLGPTLGRWTTGPREVETAAQALYLEGKMKRYSLLFSVNGGAFAVAKLLGQPNPPGGLGIAPLSLGAIVFSILMIADIWLWGAGMRNAHGARLFRPVGQTILLMIGALLCSAWILVGWSAGEAGSPFGAY